MRFALEREQEELRAIVRAFLAEKSPESEVRRLMAGDESGDPAVWKQLCGQLGLAGLAVPEEYGGSGFTFVELGIALEEMGRALLVSPFLSTAVMATTVLLASDDEAAKQAYLPGLASGELIGTVAIAEDTGRWTRDAIATTATKTTTATQTTAATPAATAATPAATAATPAPIATPATAATPSTAAMPASTAAIPAAAGTLGSDGWRVTGDKSFVLDLVGADVVFVAARVGADVGVFAVTADAAGQTRTSLPLLDQTRKQGRLSLRDTPARLVGSLAGGWAAIEKMLDLTAIAVSAEMLGGAQRALEMAVDYAKVREQFGRPIGSFQAVKHKCATVLVEVEAARSAVYYALWSAAADAEDLPATASLTKAFCADAYHLAAAENIQIHGGIGYTWEHPAHLYFKRAKNSGLFLGGSDYHREQLAQRIGI